MAKVYYRMCMNTTQINNAGLDPILKPLKELGGWPLLDENFNASTIDLTQLLANLRKYYSLDVFLSFYVYADSKNTTTNILNIDKGSLGLGMGTRDYYLNDTSYGSQMAAYKKFLTDLVLVFAKETKNLTKLDERIMRQIDEILDFEKKIANMTTPEDQRRNHSLLYNKWNIDQLQNHTPVIDWRTYFRLITSDEVYKIFRKPDFTVIVNEPTFMQNLNDLLQNTDKRIVVNYIIWRFLKMWSKILDSRFDDIFQDFAQVMLGRQQKPVRWKHCVPSTVSTFDMAVGALYVKQHFKHEDKEEALSMIKHLQTAFRQLVSKLDWMDEQTKKVAIEKAQAMLNHIGYPEFILNNTALNEYYADLDIMSQPMTFFEMNRKYSLWAQNKDFSELTKPFDRNKFDTSPAIVNAFYSPEKNAISKIWFFSIYKAKNANFLQLFPPVFYNRHFSKATIQTINYGAMGAVIGHEITHGFDDQVRNLAGCQYDRNGNLNDWWTPLAFDGFRQRTECIVEQYNNYTVVEVKTKVNGKLTQGENIADNGGVKEAYMVISMDFSYEEVIMLISGIFSFKAYRKYLDELGTEEMRLPGLLNLTNYQIFFLSYAN
uniref:Uncharacterized protein n=1 Tax=Romanomermis culicivorax TaxID=13658 RepID=A0A915L194_ROMCU